MGHPEDCFHPGMSCTNYDRAEADVQKEMTLAVLENSGRDMAELTTLRAKLAEAEQASNNDATAYELARLARAQAERQRDKAERERDEFERWIEMFDKAGEQLARAEGRPYDRATCWGEPALDVVDRIKALTAERDQLRALVQELVGVLSWLETPAMAALKGAPVLHEVGVPDGNTIVHWRPSYDALRYLRAALAKAKGAGL